MAEKAQRDLERGERLYSDQVISLEQLQDLRTQAAMRRRSCRSARVQSRLCRDHRAAATAWCCASSPKSARWCPRAQPVLLVGARDRGYIVRAALSDREVVQLKLGDPAEIRMDAYPQPGDLRHAHRDRRRRGRAQRHVPDRGALRLRARRARRAGSSRSSICIRPPRAPARLTYVPIGAVVEGDGDRASVFIVKGDRVEAPAVRVAFIAPANVALADGVQPGERVVTDGALYLQDDERIEDRGRRPRESSAASTSATG